MSRRDNAHVRCSRCHLHQSLCLCALIPRLATRTRVVLVIHRVEQRKPTNTGLLAVECLQNSELWVRGHATHGDERFQLDPATTPLLLFPSEGAPSLTEFAQSSRPVSLIVPDGNWRQASRVPHRVPCLAGVARVSLPAGPPTMYRLRHEPRDGGLATMEAIARALGVLESPAVQQTLEHVFCVMVERVLWSRGALLSSQVTGGIPDGVQRHEPRSGSARPLATLQQKPPIS
jgi:DTW domain-containing protein